MQAHRPRATLTKSL